MSLLEASYFKEKIEHIKKIRNEEFNNICNMIHNKLLKMVEEDVDLNKFQTLTLENNIKYHSKHIEKLLKEKGWDIRDMGEARDGYMIVLKIN